MSGACFIALAAALACGQTGSTGIQSGTAQDVPILIAGGDLLDISIYDNPDMLQEVRVETGGMVNLSMIGPIKVGDMTARQAGDWIAKQYADHNYLIKPQVTVLIKEASTQGISVTGEVNHPGVYPVLTTRTVLDVISLAGGFTNLADTSVTIKHRSGAEERVTVTLKADEADASLNENAVVYPGDLVVVPRAGVVYVLGDVGRPGGLAMQDNGKITVLQALAQAGGGNYTASMNGAYLLHKNDSGYVTTRLKVEDMMRGKLSDTQLVRNDILYIPTSKMKHLAANTQEMLSSAAGASVYRVP
jgi:polysaccharide export outer membrane protein